MREVFDRVADLLRVVMERKGMRVLALITCRTDPQEQEIDQVVKVVERMLDTSSDYERQSKFEVKLLPSEWVTAEGGTRLPAGYDGFAECTQSTESQGKSVYTHGWGVAWRVERPSGWIRSAVDSVRQAASQLPGSSPNLVYLQVPEGELGTVVTRIDLLRPHIEQLLQHGQHERVNAVVLTGQAILHNWSAPGVATDRYIYSILRHPTPRQQLPTGFLVFGTDFTRKNDD